MPNRTAVFDGTSKDNISRYLDAKKLVPTRFQGTDKFLDLVSWNIAWFDAKDPDRVKEITDVLDSMNADMLVLVEIADDGALDAVVSELANRKAGFYSTQCGTTGGQQRVVLMWDRDWVRAKETPHELFAKEKLVVPAEVGTKPQAVFPRLPLWGYFEARAAKAGDEGLTFELVGVHLKAQGPAPKGYKGPSKRFGIPQRTKAAKRLAQWLTKANEHNDTDVIIAGDWNAVPGETEWKALRELEKNKQVSFTKINAQAEVSHLVRLNASGAAGSRLDLHLVTKEAEANQVPKQGGVVIQWSFFDELPNLASGDRQQLFRQLKQRYSDHLPVLSRFYLTEK